MTPKQILDKTDFFYIDPRERILFSDNNPDKINLYGPLTTITKEKAIKEYGLDDVLRSIKNHATNINLHIDVEKLSSYIESKEQLKLALIPRYEVVNTYPFCPYKKGKVIINPEPELEKEILNNPYNFKKIPWWANRNDTTLNEVYHKWWDKSLQEEVVSPHLPTIYQETQPASKSEYRAYCKKKELEELYK